MRMQNVEMEFVTFDAQDVIATSGPLPEYTKVGTYYIDRLNGGSGNYALFDERTHEMNPRNENPRSPHDIFVADGGNFYTNPEKQGSYETFSQAYNSNSHYEFWQLSDELYYWLKQVNQ